MVKGTKRSREPRIEHLVVLMLENRSFDHMLGFLEHPDPCFRGLRDRPEPYYNVLEPGGEHFLAEPNGNPGLAAPDHSSDAIDEQVAPWGDLPTNGGFVRNFEARSPHNGPRVMQCLDPETSCPVLADLALQFAVCDMWFSAVPGETWPNRNFAHAGTSDGEANIAYGPYFNRTIFEQLQRAGATWRAYYDGAPQLWVFKKLWQRPAVIDRLLRRKSAVANWFPQDAFYAQVANDDLPSYSFIEPHHNDLANEWTGQPSRSNNQHPDKNVWNTRNFYAGEALIRKVYESLVARPKLFAQTLLVITYDEHGGLYDHIHPPDATPPGRPLGDWIREFLRAVRGIRHPIKKMIKFDSFGVRVPAVLVSPWISPGTVIHDQLDHSSIPATLRALFAPGSRSLTRRDRQSRTFHHVVRPPYATREPRPSPQAPTPGVQVDHLDESGGIEQQRPDTREPRPPAGSAALPPLPLLKTSRVVSTGAARVGASPSQATGFDRQLLELTLMVGDELDRQRGMRPFSRASRMDSQGRTVSEDYILGSRIGEVVRAFSETAEDARDPKRSQRRGPPRPPTSLRRRVANAARTGLEHLRPRFSESDSGADSPPSKNKRSDKADERKRAKEDQDMRA